MQFSNLLYSLKFFSTYIAYCTLYLYNIKCYSTLRTLGGFPQIVQSSTETPSFLNFFKSDGLGDLNILSYDRLGNIGQRVAPQCQGTLQGYGIKQKILLSILIFNLFQNKGVGVARYFTGKLIICNKCVAKVIFMYFILNPKVKFI